MPPRPRQKRVVTAKPPAASHPAPGVPEAAGEIRRAIADHPDGAVLSIVALPRASRNAVERMDGDALSVRLAAPPVDGAANASLLRLLADALDVPRSALRLLAGHTGRRKRVLVAGVTPGQVASRLFRHLRP